MLGAELAESAKRLVYAVKRGFVVGDFEVRCALRDELRIVRKVCMCVWRGCVRQRGLRRGACWASWCRGKFTCIVQLFGVLWDVRAMFSSGIW